METDKNKLTKDNFKKTMEKVSDLSNKEFAVREEKTLEAYEDLQFRSQTKNSIENLQISDVLKHQQNTINEKVLDSIMRIKDKTVFINRLFEEKVDLNPGALIALGACPGNGKSTATANIALAVLEAGKKAIILTNEETTEDIFGRIACLKAGLDFNKRHLFSEGDGISISSISKELASHVIVFDDVSSGVSGTTTTWRGIEAILKKLESTSLLNDAGVLILDYFQNINPGPSTTGPYFDLKKLSSKLSGIKNTYPVPIVLMVQMRPVSKISNNSLSDYYGRVRDCRDICNDATCFVEMIALKESRLTIWAVHKNRFSAFSGPIITAWKKGRIIPANINTDGVQEILKKLRGEK